jgi:glucose 1-dehydrogenase
LRLGLIRNISLCGLRPTIERDRRHFCSVNDRGARWRGLEHPEERTMKAVAVFPDKRDYKVIDHPEPHLGAPTQARIRMLDIGICGTDKEIVEFQYGTPPPGSEYLIIGHESLGEVVEVGPEVTGLRVGDLAVTTVRRPCPHPECVACRSGRQDFCYTGDFTERGIKERHGYMTEFVVEEAMYISPVPRSLRDVGVLVEPLTIAEKGITQLWQVQKRLPWACPGEGPTSPGYCHKALVLGAGPVGLLGAMKLVVEGFETYVYSRMLASEKKDAVTKAIGATFIYADEVSVADMAKQIGNIDVVYEAVGASTLAFDVLQYLGTNGVFIFTGVPGRKEPTPVDTSLLMRDRVLKNQILFGTVNASLQSFQDAIKDLGTFLQRWPDAVRTLITNRFPIDYATEPLSGKVGGIKNVIAVGK